MCVIQIDRRGFFSTNTFRAHTQKKKKKVLYRINKKVKKTDYRKNEKKNEDTRDKLKGICM